MGQAAIADESAERAHFTLDRLSDSASAAATSDADGDAAEWGDAGSLELGELEIPERPVWAANTSADGQEMSTFHNRFDSCALSLGA